MVIDKNVVLPMVTALVGFVSAQFYVFIQTRISREKIKNNIFLELSDIDVQLENAQSIFEKNIKHIFNREFNGSYPSKIRACVFNGYFGEVAIHLTRSQRVSYQIIHGYLDDINDEIIYLRSETRIFRDDAFSNGKIERSKLDIWMDRYRSIYTNICMARWHIMHHINNKSKPELPTSGSVYDNYQDFCLNIDKTLSDFLNENI
ncbi:hypothetical protein [Aeromonas dhakensis]|uniref:hypothetical protein n=1 Tax=Aeromonas dhakensis TaxID=196024 RepID=UPI0028DF7867|nr:hypothetical protein [Aeromonas dhakensis]